MVKYILFILMVAIGTAGQLLLKQAVNHSAVKIGSVFTVADAVRAVVIFLGNPVILLVFSLSAFGALIYLLLLLKFDLTFIFPALAVTYVSVLFFSWLLLREQISVLRVAGTLIITVGVILIGLSR